MMHSKPPAVHCHGIQHLLHDWHLISLLRLQLTASVLPQDSAQEATEKWGLEAGLWKVFTNKEGDKKGKSKGQQAKDLLARYGSAYLITSISFALVSFGLCYALVNSGEAA